jgi:hypothetical protein
MSGRDLNAGVKASYGGMTATVAWTKIECLLFSTRSTGRLAASLSYGFQDWSALVGVLRHRRAVAGLATAEPSVRDSAPKGTLPRADGPGFESILFGWDSWQITRAAAASLLRTAALIRDRPQAPVLITGYACEGGSPEANAMLAGKRAFAVFEFLKAKGVPERRMSYRARIATSATPLPLQRAVRFDAELKD